MRKITIVLGLYGRIEKNITGLGKIIEYVSKEKEDIQLIISAKGYKWASLPIMQTIKLSIPDCSVIYNSNNVTLAEMYNCAIDVIEADYVMFIDAGIDALEQKIEQFYDYYSVEDGKEHNICYWQNLNKNDNISNMNRYGMLLAKNYHDNNDIVIRTDYVKKHRFNATPILGGCFFREWITSAAKNNEFCSIGKISKSQFGKKSGLVGMRNLDIVEKYIIRSCALLDKEEQDAINQGFMHDLSLEERSKIEGLIQADDGYKVKKSYRILILGGVWEYHHIQIVFLNYLERLAGTGFATYNIKLDYECSSFELNNYDLVIFTRSRSDNAVNLAEYCYKKHIKTVYMLDDNWISIAKDFPQYGNIFVKGNPNFDNFIEIVKRCDYVWYFNEYIKEDLQPYAKAFLKSQVSVDDKLFVSNEKLDKNGKILIGYSGSLRYDNTAFKALAKVAQERSDIKIVFVGNLSDEQKALFKEVDIICIEFSTYNIYAKNLAMVSPDLLIAPLDNSRTSQSKCFNKYIESGVIGAATVFSKVRPYIDVIIDKKNGYLITDETEEGWRNKINEILDDKELLKTVQKNAHDDVIANYSVDAVLPLVKENIERVMSE